MGESAREQVRRIREETAYRKSLWARMQVAAKEALEAVTIEARRHGVRSQNWLSGTLTGKEKDHVRVNFPTYTARLAKIANTKQLWDEPAQHSLLLHGSGTIERPYKGGTYEGYPDLVEDDVEIFKTAAVETLMASLHDYIQAVRRQRRHPKR